MISLHGEDRCLASKALCLTIWDAKRDWLQSLIEDPDMNLWDLAAWQKGRCRSWLPPIRGPTHTTVIPSEMADIFRTRFFDFPTAPLGPLHPTDSPHFPTRPFHNVTPSEIAIALASTSNKSASGPSGINYKLLKWCFQANELRLTHILDCTLTLGHHLWPKANVIIIPKPNKPDYAATKAY